MKHLIILTTLLFSNLNTTNCQNIDSVENILQIQSTGNGNVFYLIKKNIGYDSFNRQLNLLYIKCFNDSLKLNSIIILDTTIYGDWMANGVFKNATIGFLGDFYIYFINKNLGFVYGNFTGYGPNPFLLRTNNGGNSWKKIDGLPLNTNFEKNNFYIHQQKGFILLTQYWNLNDGKIEYYITNNCGETWQRKIFQLKHLEYSISNCDVQFSPTGLITITAWMKKKKNHTIKKTIILQSNDFGESFTEYK